MAFGVRVGEETTPAVDVDEDKLERWEIKAEKAAGALKNAMSSDVSVARLNEDRR